MQSFRFMKKLFLILALCLSGFVTAVAQSEEKTKNARPSSFNTDFDYMLFDFSLPELPKMPKFDTQSLLMPNRTTDYSLIFKLDDQWTFGYDVSDVWVMDYSVYGFANNSQVQMGIFKINENLQLGLYGQYDAKGRRLQGTNLFPWDKNSFIGGLELKINKNIGIRVEVRQGAKNHMYPY